MAIQKDPIADLVAALKALPSEATAELLKQAGLIPTTQGMTPDQIQTIVMTAGATNARAMQLALRRENPTYPERSVFNPRGRFDDDGRPQPEKLKLRRPTFFLGVRLSDELLTEEEIDLCNRFTSTKEVVAKSWKAEIVRRGSEDRLYLDVPAKTIDDRMNLPASLSLILRELLLGSEAVNPTTLQKQIDELKARLEGLTGSHGAVA